MIAIKTDPLSRSMQDYLKMIYSQTREDHTTSTVSIAEALDVKPASVTHMLQKLDELEPRLVNYQKHHGVSLTAEGERVALEIIRRHRLLEQFLYEMMAYPWEKIHAEAEELEHAISPYFEERIAQMLNDPAFDPHGDPIPNRDLNLADERQLIPLARLRPGQKAVVSLIKNQDAGMLAYLSEAGIRPGTQVEVIQANPLDGSMQVAVGGQAQVFGQETVETILVEIEPNA